MFRQRLRGYLAERWPNHLFEIETPPDPKLGDFSVNLAFSLAKAEGTGPMEAAAKVVEAITNAMGDQVREAVATPPGFVNVMLRDDFLRSELERIAETGDAYGTSGAGEGKTAIVEYSSPNIAKFMHVGHLRSTVIGDALANVHEALGYDVIRWNYVGDWGTQFGNLIAAYQRWGQDADFSGNPIEAMEQLYVRFHREAAEGAELERQGREEFRKLEAGDKGNRKLWERFRTLSLEQFSRMYEKFRIGLADGGVIVKGESDYERDLDPLIDELSGAGLTREGEGGALIVDLDPFDIKTPGMLRKGDGATLYLTRDIASLRDRIASHGPSHILYVVGNDQALHFEQLFAVAELMAQKGLLDGDGLPGLRHVKFGLTLGPDGKKFSTREGNVVPLAQLYEEAVRRACDVVRAKNPELGATICKDIGSAVAIAAIKYNDLKQHPHSDIVFDWNAMLNLTGDSGPYLQYTYARLASIVAKARSAGSGRVPGGKADLSRLEHPGERCLMRLLLDYPDAVAECAEHSALNPLARYLYRLGCEANGYYEAVRVLDDDDAPRKAARVQLISTVAGVLERGLALLGIQALDRI